MSIKHIEIPRNVDTDTQIALMHWNLISARSFKLPLDDYGEPA
jgi:hypothetical protein